jgi:hypothetical protein
MDWILHLNPEPLFTWIQKSWTPRPSQWLFNITFSLIGVLLFFLIARPRRIPQGLARPPPHVGSWIPWLGSGIHLASDPDKFFERAT